VKPNEGIGKPAVNRRLGRGFLIKTLMPFYLLPSPSLFPQPTEGISHSEARRCTKSSAFIFSLIKRDFFLPPLLVGAAAVLFGESFEGGGPCQVARQAPAERKGKHGPSLAYEKIHGTRVATCPWSAKCHLPTQRVTPGHPPLTPSQIWW